MLAAGRACDAAPPALVLGVGGALVLNVAGDPRGCHLEVDAQPGAPGVRYAVSACPAGVFLTSGLEACMASEPLAVVDPAGPVSVEMLAR